MYCKKCGAQIDDDSVFCAKCGANITVVSENIEVEKIHKSGAKKQNIILQIIMMVSSVLSIGACLLPMVGISFLGTKITSNFVQDGSGDGMLIIFLMFIAITLLLLNKHKFVIIPSMLALVVAVMALLSLNANLNGFTLESGFYILVVLLICNIICSVICIVKKQNDKLNVSKGIKITFTILCILAAVATIGYYVWTNSPTYQEIKSYVEPEVGENVTFGSYYQENADKKTPMEWIIVAKNGKNALLLSKYCINASAYSDSDENTSWENSKVRTWLNNDFINDAFETQEIKRIIDYSIQEKESTYTDKVFLLTAEEASSYFTTDEKRKSVATHYAELNGAKIYNWCKGTEWWLRSTTSYNTIVYTDYDGHIITSGAPASRDNYGVRPAIWIKIDRNLNIQ